MRYVDEYRDRGLVAKVAGRIRAEAAGRDFAFMEVCGTHTMAIFRYGLRGLLPRNIRLISGPGCPVCVTPNSYIDTAIALAAMKRVLIATFGDMMRVPGSRSSLEAEKSKGASVRPVYSTDDALELARRNRDKEIVFLGIGFETTAPTVAASVIEAAAEGLKNFSVLSGHKTMPEVMAALLDSGRVPVDGFLLPGHVSAIIGTRPFGFLARRYGKGGVVAGFEPLDIMQAILMLVRQRSPAVEIQYARVAAQGGNPVAQKILKKVFTQSPAEWRGLGMIKDSGLSIRKEFAQFDAERRFRIKVGPAAEPKGCLCASVLKGEKIPTQCRLFGASCTPEHPVGACMVSSEGTCAAYYRFGHFSRNAQPSRASGTGHRG